MNILKRAQLLQITSKIGIFSGFYRTHPIRIQNIHGSISTNFSTITHTQSVVSRSNQFMKNTINRKYATISSLWNKLFDTRLRSRMLKKGPVIMGKTSILYGKTVDNLKHQDFITKFNMPNTFNSWFLITELHVWMLMVRAMGEKENAKDIRDGIVTAMWTDAVTRATKMAPGSAKKMKLQIVEISEQFQYALLSYDEGLATTDQQLASALWVRFFASNCDNYEHIELLVKYIRYNLAQLDKLDFNDFLDKANVDFPPLLEFENGKY